jgi:hypothetical protein
MTERNFGDSGAGFFVAKVVNREDKEEAGRLQIRVMGVHDDTANVPDKELPWGRPVIPTTSASHKEVRTITDRHDRGCHRCWYVG